MADIVVTSLLPNKFVPSNKRALALGMEVRLEKKGVTKYTMSSFGEAKSKLRAFCVKTPCKGLVSVESFFK